MIIQCPACHARARIPDSQEGAKVRCGECSRIFVAGDSRQRKSSGAGSKIGLWLGLGAGGVAILFFLMMVSKGKGTDYTQAKEEEEAPDPDVKRAIDSTSFEDSPEIQAAVRIHQAAWNGNDTAIRVALDGPRVYAWKAEVAARAAAEGDEEVEITEEQRLAWQAEFEAFPQFRQSEILTEYSDLMTKGEERDLVADWEPYDGELISSDDAAGEAVVRLQVASRDEGSAESRHVQWTLHRQRNNWLACSWERWYTEAEKRAMRKRAGRGYEKVTLSDGSQVFEREPEPLAHLDTTPPELAKRIDSLIATMIDLDLTKEASRAREDIVEIGRPAIPRLLTKLYEIPLETEEQSIQINQVVVALRDITGQYHGYKPQEFLGSGTGTTKERRESAIKQWFAWWHRKQRTFVEKEVGEDALEGRIKQTEKDKRWLETHDG